MLNFILFLTSFFLTNYLMGQNVLNVKIKDVDGNAYQQIVIGNQIWLDRNLQVTHFNNGALIPFVAENKEWSNLTTPGYCFYQNKKENTTSFGVLYNWYVIDKGNVCPVGWHVPSDDEWTVLSFFLGGDLVAGSQIKSNTGWNLNGNGSDTSKFQALPSGVRFIGSSNFSNEGTCAVWWSATEGDDTDAWFRKTNYYHPSLLRYSTNKAHGFSIRCLKDE